MEKRFFGPECSIFSRSSFRCFLCGHFFLSVGDIPIGAIILGKKSHKAGYSSQELKLLSNFSAQASIALNNAIALDQVEKRKVELEKFYKLTIGRELRMAELKEKIKELENK